MDATGYHVNVPWDIARCLASRGLGSQKPGALALFAMWNPSQSDAGSQTPSWHSKVDQAHRAVVEQSFPSTVRELADKIRLADYLREHGIQDWAPETVMSTQELGAVGKRGDEIDEGLWFLKHSLMARNEGVTVHCNRCACLDAWVAMPEAERGDYLAQREVSGMLLDPAGRKLTLRVYVLLMARFGSCSLDDGGDDSDDGGPRAWALARRQFVCRIHPKPYDPSDPNPERHVHSTLGMSGVEYMSGDDWAHRASAWPNIQRMLSDCIEPFFVILRG